MARFINGENDRPFLNGVVASSRKLSRGSVGTKRQTYNIRLELLAKLRSYAHWEHLGVSEVVNQALEEFFAEKEVKIRPPKRFRSRGKG
jgi:hypothetical protein